MTKKIFIIAGEASGDMHGANLIMSIIQEAEKERHKVEFVGLGGDKMQSAGCTLLQHYKNMAYMGIVAVLKNQRKIKENFQIAYNGLLKERPDKLILIDYPSFNLRVARFCKRHLSNTEIIYYIPPKVWAWKKWRVHKIARLSDKILGIFPFEEDFYKQYGYKIEYVGNPTVDSIRKWKNEHSTESLHYDKEVIAILPGSRQSEIEHCLPRMLAAARLQEKYQIVVAGAPAINQSYYDKYLEKGESVVFNQTYDLLSIAKVAIVNSGTATLETALIGCPQVAVYHIACAGLVKLIRPLLFKIPHFTLVNIIYRNRYPTAKPINKSADKDIEREQFPVIKELIAHLFTVERIDNELKLLLNNNPYRQEMLNRYAQISDTLGQQCACLTAAKRCLE